MSLESAQSQFLGLVQSCLLTGESRAQFASWLRATAIPALVSEEQDSVLSGRRQLEQLSEYLRGRVPSVDAVMPSEQIAVPASESDLNAANCVHVDGFLFDEAEEERLVEEGKLSRAFCKDCGSKNTEELRYVTHSCSKARLEYMFTALLPPLDGKHVLDVGSRLGAVLYGANAFSAAARITGIEINAEFCALTSEAVAKFGLGSRVEVLHRELTTCPELLSSADVVVLNNVFDWFMPEETQVGMWRFLWRWCKKGALMVTIPGVDKATERLQTGIDLAAWLRPLNPRVELSEDDESQVEMSEIKLYQVIKENEDNNQ